MVATTVTPGKGHKAEIAIIERQLRQLDFDAPDYDDEYARLRAERARLKNLPSAPDLTETEPTGQKTEDYWPTLDPAGKRQFLLVNKFRVTARREADRSVSVVVGPDPVTFEGGEFFKTVAALATMTA